MSLLIKAYEILPALKIKEKLKTASICHSVSGW